MNQAERLKEAVRAEHIIAAEALKFNSWLRTLEVVPTIVGLREKAEQIRLTEVRKTLNQMNTLTEDEVEAVHVLTRSVVNKLLHDPILFLKRTSMRSRKELYLDVTRKLFQLDRDLPEIENEENQLSLDSNKGS